MSISIIIATKNRHQLVFLLLDSISNSNFRDFEVIIVDQSKQTISLNVKYDFSVLILKNDSGASSSRNLGAKFAKNRYLWFLDDDCTLNKNSNFDNITDHLLYFVEWEERKKSKFLFRLSLISSLIRKLFFVRASGAPFFIIDKTMFFEVGGFDTNLGPGCKLGAAEDLDLCLRSMIYLNFKKKKSYKFLSEIILNHKLEYHNNNKRISYLKSRHYVYNKLNFKLLLFLDLFFSLLTFDFERFKTLRSF